LRFLCPSPVVQGDTDDRAPRLMSSASSCRHATAPLQPASFTRIASPASFKQRSRFRQFFRLSDFAVPSDVLRTS
jgi:hypothetical protein